MGDLLDELLFTAEEAAAEVGVKVPTIWSWVNRGYLRPAGTRGKHRLYRLSDVFEAEKERKRKHRRRPNGEAA
jgi:DNA-binding transcriptional MerR regulator